MEARTLVQISAVAAVLGGAAIALAGLLDYGIDDEAAMSATATTGLWIAMAGSMFAAAILLALAQPGLYLVQKHRTGAWGVAAFVLGFLGFAVFVGLAFALAFVAPTLATIAPAFLDSESGPGGLLGTAFMVGFPLLLLALVAVGAVTLRANVLPRAAAALVLVGAVLDLVGGALPFPVDGRIFAGVGFAWLGWATWRLAQGPAAAPAADAAAA